MSTRPPLAAALALLCAAASAASAADHHVTPGQSIQAAIDAAQDGDRVLVHPGTYVERIDFVGKAILVLGLGGPSATTLSGSGSIGPVVTFHGGETTTSVLRGFTVRDGYHQPLSSSEGYGAGISAWVGSPFSGTTASPTIEDCVIRDNQSILAPGGGVAGDPVLRRCVLLENFVSASDGAAVYGAPEMQWCLVAGNSSLDGDGGGVTVAGGTASLTEVTLVENRVRYGYGGGLAVRDGAHVDVTRCRIVKNDADFLGQGSVRGAGVYVSAGGSAAVDRCTVVDNSGDLPSCWPRFCPDNVGGVYGPAVLTNSIVRGNVANELWNVVSVTYSDVEGGHPGAGNFDADPSFVDRASDLNLRPGSPCIDAGDPSDIDPDGSVADVGAAPFARLYVLEALHETAWLDPGWPSISAGAGGRQRLRLLGDPSDAGRPYWIVGSASGTWPGTPIGPGLVLPLNVDAYFFHTALYPDQLPLVSSTGILAPDGLGGGELLLPPGLASGLAGTTLHHAGVVFHATPPWSPAWVTGAVAAELAE